MLERHEQEALAQIEARLHAEDPDLSEALDAGVAPVHLHPVLRSLIVLAVACAITAGATVWVGPDLGGLLAVLTLSYAAMYAWGAFRVCRGTRTN
jgi:hypothetical protein